MLEKQASSTAVFISLYANDWQLDMVGHCKDFHDVQYADHRCVTHAGYL